jgi:tyrosyl-tRNA synthetase
VTDIFDELQWRGLVAQTTDEATLREALAEGPITVYCGFDPSAPSLHFGNFVQLSVLRRMQAAGHRVICLVGGSTGLIGDPKPDSERVLQDKDTIAASVRRIQELVAPLLDFHGDNPALLVNNLDWTAPLSAIDFLRDVGRHFRVNQMIRKEAVARRLESDQGISYTEFSYQMLQAIDFLELYRSHGCTLQIGGSDQWGNITSGVDLVHRAEGVSVHALATPLLVDSTGRKFGKSEGNAVWLSADMTSPYAFYQYFLNVEDASVVAMLKALTDRTREEIADLEKQVAEEPFRRTAQRTLAADVTALVHGAEATAAVQGATSGPSTPAPCATRPPSCRPARSPSATPSSTPSWPWGSSSRATRRDEPSPREGRRSTTPRSPIPSSCSPSRTSCTARSRSSSADAATSPLRAGPAEHDAERPTRRNPPSKGWILLSHSEVQPFGALGACLPRSDLSFARGPGYCSLRQPDREERTPRRSTWFDREAGRSRGWCLTVSWSSFAGVRGLVCSVVVRFERGSEHWFGWGRVVGVPPGRRVGSGRSSRAGHGFDSRVCGG